MCGEMLRGDFYFLKYILLSNIVCCMANVGKFFCFYFIYFFSPSLILMSCKRLDCQPSCNFTKQSVWTISALLGLLG